jgi:hypothetical protein
MGGGLQGDKSDESRGGERSAGLLAPLRTGSCYFLSLFLCVQMIKVPPVGSGLHQALPWLLLYVK